MNNTKKCNTCGIEKPLTQFYKNGIDQDGNVRLRADCKTCYKVDRHLDKKTHTKFRNNTKLRTNEEDAKLLTLNDWRDALIFFGNSCAYCGHVPTKRKERLTKDHVVPVTAGGRTIRKNVVPACSKCNCSKSNQPLKKWYPRQPFFTDDRHSKIKEWCDEQQ